MLRLPLIILGGWLVVMGWVLLLARQQPAQSPWIAFVSSRDGNLEIYKMRPDGSRQTRLTDYPGNDMFPLWTPDGQWLIFASDRNASPTYPYTRAIFRMRSDGRRVEQLTDQACLSTYLTWNVAQAQVVYKCWVWTGTEANPVRIYQIGADGTGLHLFDARMDYLFEYDTPIWSADGDWIVYVEGSRQRPGHYHLARVRPDGREQKLLTPDQVAYYPGWTPDGAILYVGSDGLYTISLDGTQQQKITAGEQLYSTPAWSPDGKWIALARLEDRKYTLYRLELATGQSERLTRVDGDDIAPIWSPIIDLRWRFGVIALAGVILLGAGFIYPAPRPFPQTGRAFGRRP